LGRREGGGGKLNSKPKEKPLDGKRNTQKKNGQKKQSTPRKEETGEGGWAKELPCLSSIGEKNAVFNHADGRGTGQRGGEGEVKKNPGAG